MRNADVEDVTGVSCVVFGMQHLALCNKTDYVRFVMTVVQHFLNAAQERTALLSATYDGAVRLFNGYTEGFPGVAVELYGKTLVIRDAVSSRKNHAFIDGLLKAAVNLFPFVTTALWKTKDASVRTGILLFGKRETLCDRILEDNVWYAIQLALHHDTSLYLDTRLLRLWAKANLSGKVVLNAFAYTGSLGIAAQAAPAAQVIHTDRNKAFLAVAKASYALNGWKILPAQFVVGDFFQVMRRFKRERKLFDCVFVDPPYFWGSHRGDTWHADDMLRLLNKVRPLVAHDGWLVAVNNGVFVSGADYMKTLQCICAEGYATIEALVPVPFDFVGTNRTRMETWGVDPSPFNYPTKIAILRMTRKDRRSVGLKVAAA